MKRERADNDQVRELLQIAPAEDDQLQRSSRNKSGFKGVEAKGNKYQAHCTTPPCRWTNLGSFGTPEEAAQAYVADVFISAGSAFRLRLTHLRLISASYVNHQVLSAL
jgi:hypothetical protein